MSSRPEIPEPYRRPDTVWVAGDYVVTPARGREPFTTTLEHGADGWAFWDEPSTTHPLGIRPLPDDWAVEEAEAAE